MIYLVAGANTTTRVSSSLHGWKYRDVSLLSAMPYIDFWFHSKVNFFTRFDLLFHLVIFRLFLSTSIGFYTVKCLI